MPVGHLNWEEWASWICGHEVAQNPDLKRGTLRIQYSVLAILQFLII